jgi:D-glycero-alpha-D-manno-heptose-7-phosphate kinase
MKKNLKKVFSSAPLRMNDIGGWTDTWFSGEGKVLNMAISPRVEVEMQISGNSEKRTDRVCVHALDFGESFRVNPENPDYSNHPLLQGTLNSLPIPEELELEISIRSYLPAGSAVGTSASVCVSLLGALDVLQPKRFALEDIASLAHRVETEKLGLQSGIQDQVCAAQGGVCFIHMPAYPEARVTRLALCLEFWEELDRRLSLVYLGSAHSSSTVHDLVIASLERGDPRSSQIQVLRSLAEEAESCLKEGDLVHFGRVMDANNEAQRALHPDLISAEADSVIRIAKKHDALGWKVNGAGGQGGSLTILGCQDDKKRETMDREIDSLGKGIRNLPVSLSADGLKVVEPDE